MIDQEQSNKNNSNQVNVEPDGREQRAEPRIDNQLPVIVNAPGHSSHETIDFYDCYSKDLSAQGARIITHEPFSIGEQVEMIIEMKRQQRRFLMMGTVKWCLEIDETPTYYTGLCFEQHPDTDCEKWQQVFH